MRKRTFIIVYSNENDRHSTRRKEVKAKDRQEAFDKFKRDNPYTLLSRIDIK